KYALMQEELDRKVQDAKLQAASDIAGQLGDLLGKQTAVGKAVAIAQATIDTYQAAANALRSIPFPFNIAAAATTVATGLANVKKIVSTKVPSTDIQGSRTRKAEKGIIAGKRHYQGGELINAEAGEAIMTRGAVSMFPNLLTAINQMGRGIRLMESGGLT